LALTQDAAGLDRLPVPCEYDTATIAGSMLRLPSDEPALAGLSNAETHFRNFRELPLVSRPQPADEHGLLAAETVGAGKLLICQAAPWMFDPAEFNHDRMTYRRTGVLVSRLLANLGAELANPLLQNWRQPAVVLPDLTTGWLGEADPDSVGEEEGWFQAEYDDSDWQPIAVPATYESQRPDLENYDGVFWYRRRFDLGVVPEGLDLILLMGAADDEDWTYLNGQLIGKVTAETHPDNHWNVERRYPIPPGLLKPEGNVLAVRVRDTYLSGGIVRGPVAIQAPGRWNESYYIDDPEPGDDPYRYYRW
jgi:hypothetical protein